MPAWLIWAIVAVALAVGEIFTPGLFFLGPIALAALAATLVAALGGDIWIQLIVFGVGSFAAVGFLRPIAKAHVKMPRAIRTGAAALEGAKAVVLQRVDGRGGKEKMTPAVLDERISDAHKYLTSVLDRTAPPA